MASEKKDRLALHVYFAHPRDGRGYGHVRASVVAWDDSMDDPIDSVWEWDSEHNKLGIDSQTSWDSLAGTGTLGTHGPMYAVQACWREDNPGIKDLERGVASLRKITRRLDKDTEREGAPLTIGQFCMRVARAAGCKWVVTRNRHQRPIRWKLVESIHVIDNVIHEWKQEARERLGLAEAS